MGYYRPVTADGFKTIEWNLGKVSEFKERKYFRLNHNELSSDIGIDKRIKEIESLERIKSAL